MTAKKRGPKPRHDFVASHTARPSVSKKHPILVEKRVMKDVELADAETWAVIERAVHDGNDVTPAFQVEHFGVDGHDLVLIVRAANKNALTRGMQGLSIRIARRLNRETERTGSIFVERYRAEPLATDADLERALARL